MWMNFPALYANMLCFVNALVTGHKTCTVMSMCMYGPFYTSNFGRVECNSNN
jgi:hypothetical protein